MNAELLRGWLGLKEVAWPPDDHILLGVAPKERDLARIEHQVQERLAKLRCYQISHPEEATEGMNRLAQAFVNFMEGCSKPTEAVFETPMPTAQAETFIDGPTRHDWQAAPPPVRRSGPTPIVAASNGKPVIPKAKPAPNAIANTQMIVHLAQDSPEARAGLGTLEAVIRRVDETRRLLIAWNAAGRWLRDPKRRPSKPADDQDLSRRLNAVHESLKSYPAIIGHPGTPGYRVAATARLHLNALFVRGMDAPHRELLSLDWMYGRKVLLAYRKFLLQHFKKMRHRGPLALSLHFVRSLVNDHPVAVTVSLLGLAVAASWMWWKWLR